MTDRVQHNADQVRYFSERPLPRMTPTGDAITPYVARHVDAVIAAGAIGGDDKVIDVGCGPGKYTLALAAAGLEVAALDLTPALIDELQRVAPGIEARVGDLADPPDDLHGRFDVVAGFMVLHHVNDLTDTFAGVRRLLAPGGRAVFLEPNPYFPGYYVQITLTPGLTWKGDGGIVRMRPRPLAAAATAAGLRDFRTERFGAVPPALANRRWGQRVERALEAVPGWRWGRAFQVFTMTAP